MSHRRGGAWWEAFLNLTKEDLADLYSNDLMYQSFHIHNSCTGDSKHTNNFTACQKCFGV